MLARALALTALFLAGGCASSAREDVSPPTVMGDLSADAAAFGAGGRTLERADFRRQLGTAEAPAPAGPTPSPLPLPDEPAAVAESRSVLGDGRVRLVWRLRGGFGSAAAEGAGEGRRKVAVTPPDPAPLVALVQSHLGDRGTAAPLPANNRLVIVCDVDAEAGVLDLLGDVDRPARQVRIEARVFEVRHDFDYQQGVRLLANRVAEDGTQTALSTFRTAKALEAAAGAAPFAGSVLSLVQNLSDSGIGIDASFELLAEVGLIQVVSQPRLTVAEGRTGYILAGQELPIQSAEIVNNALKASTQYKPVGVQLYVTPQLVTGDRVRLHAVSVVSSVAGFTPLPVLRGSDGDRGSPLLLNPVIDAREAETSVTVGLGETLVISGLRMVRDVTREDKVPGLGDVPILGNLFKSKRTQRRTTDLYFFLTPTLADTGDAIASAR